MGRKGGKKRKAPPSPELDNAVEAEAVADESTEADNSDQQIEQEYAVNDDQEETGATQDEPTEGEEMEDGVVENEVVEDEVLDQEETAEAAMDDGAAEQAEATSDKTVPLDTTPKLGHHNKNNYNNKFRRNGNRDNYNNNNFDRNRYKNNNNNNNNNYNSNKYNQDDYNDNNRGYGQKKGKHSFTRIRVDPSRQYQTPESRESWGPNVKGKKFKKEKGKKKRSFGGFQIDGSVKSTRFDSK